MILKTESCLKIYTNYIKVFCVPAPGFIKSTGWSCLGLWLMQTNDPNPTAI